jgi:hypothetical protein
MSDESQPPAPGPENPAPGEPAEHLPASSFWPFTLALGIAMSLIGVITKVEVVIIGLTITVVSLIGWIRQARIEYRALP